MISDPRVDFLLTKLDQQRKTLSTLAGGVAEQHARVATDLNVCGRYDLRRDGLATFCRVRESRPARLRLNHSAVK